MKPINYIELQSLVDYFNECAGARLQSVELYKSQFVLGLYLKGGLIFWMIDVRPQFPIMLPMKSEQVPAKRGEIKPVVLFLRAHFIDKILKQVHMLSENDRIAILTFSNGATMEARLYPTGPNLILTAGDKKISFNKVKDATHRQDYTGELQARSIPVLGDEYFKHKPNVVPSASNDKKIQKLKIAIEKLKVDIEAKKSSPWLRVGEALKINQNKMIAEELQDYVDSAKSLSWNIENAYAKHKAIQVKLIGSESRLTELQAELHKIENNRQGLASDTEPRLKRHEKIKDVKGIHYELPSGHLLYVGRKAEENLRVLRAAKPWDFWFHLRDYPGAHAILRRNKQETLVDAVLSKAAEYLLKENFRSKREKYKGEAFDIIVCEVRYVHPIKGDKLGRVTFSNERVIRVRCP